MMGKINVFATVRRVFTRPVTTAVKLEADQAGLLKSWKDIPGPSSLPFLGPALHFLPIVGSTGPVTGYKLWDHWYKTYGPIVRIEGMFGRQPFIVTYDTASIEQVMRTENWLPERPGFDSLVYFRKKYYEKRSAITNATGLITEQGDNWKSFRSTVNPVLMQPKTIKLYNNPIDEVALNMVERLKKLRNEKNVITEDFEAEMNKWALESIGVVAIGSRIGCLSTNLPEDSIARQLIQSVHDTFDVINKLDFRPSLWRVFPTANFKKGMETYERQMRLTGKLIKQGIEKLKTNPSNENEQGVLEKLLKIDEHIAVVMTSDMFIAGVDTTANTMIGALYQLANNPEKQTKLRNEILNPSPDNRKPYLRACIKETLRMYPAAPGNLRRTTKEYNLLGYLIPKGTQLVFPHDYMSKLESEFPKANDFVPERWLVEKDDPLYHGQAHRFASSPFGFGVRSCIGRRIAELELETFLTRMIQNFKIEWFGPPIKVITTSINYFVKPYNFVFKDMEKLKDSV